MYAGYNAVQELVKDDYAYDLTTVVNGVPAFASARAELDSMVDDFATKVVAGAEDISALGAFIARWDSAGGRAAEAAINDWYDQNFR